jgi:hypothetical protein
MTSVTLLCILLSVVWTVILAIFLYKRIKEYFWVGLYLILCVYLFSFISGGYVFKNITERDTAIKCLNGNNPYKMVINYEKHDSIYVPTDTIYIKK